MTAKDRNDIIKGIRAYSEQQKRLLALIDEHDNYLTAADFDAEFRDYIVHHEPDGTTVNTRKIPQLYIWPHENDAFLLGSMTQGEWAKWLHLLQLMARIGLVKIETDEDGRVAYKRGPNETP